ncbi:MAG: acetoacetate--CoA ligase [Salaquimonas sp.]|jgi:acetoacetyl-CoA synthetase|nr:acetoacetate--CoA ligase [Salaquimonas sp.]
MTTDTPLWTPPPERVAASRMAAFMQWLSERTGRTFSGYDALHAWSIEDVGGFWDAVWDYCGVIGEKGATVAVDLDKMPGARFFPEGRINFAENLLWKTGRETAIVFRGEDKVASSLSWDELRALVSRLQQAMRAMGISKDDRVAAMMPNMPETVAAMLAATSLGAIWSSCSPDFGEQGVLDRFGQIEPKLFIACDGYWYNGKRIDIAGKLAGIVPKLNAAVTLIVPYAGDARAIAEANPSAVEFDAFIAPYDAEPFEFERVEFAHPLYILFSSGTTGIPKCIVHSHGGTLLKHLSEQQLHSDLGEGDRLFYFTTCGWMMWNWLVSGLASGATLMLYDGSPFYPDGNVLFDYAAETKFDFFGTSAKFIDSVRKAGLRPIDTHDLSSVKTIASTGSPLAPENFEFVYLGISADIHLASISGGTDIVGCFVLAIPGKPVWKGEIQGPALGLAVEVWDEDGHNVVGEKGELVCVKPFTSMPVSFWNDPDGAKYHAAYFERFDNVWCHGDFAEWTEHGGMIIHGRSDATLNPGGVRIGTAEIYNQVEQMEEVLEALCIGQQWDGDVRVVLFVRLAPGVTLNDELEKKIRTRIRTGASPRHVPARIVAIADIPRTKSGKITELAVREIVHGRAVKNMEALANPEALELYRDRPELAS